MSPLAESPESTVDDVTVATPTTIILDLAVAIAPADEALLASADPLLTLTDPVAIPGLSGTFYLSLSKTAPIQVEV